jgi:Domain of Unknown Function (DUF1080)
MLTHRLTLLASITLAVSALAEDQGSWTSLFNGKDLTGWTRHSGVAEYRVEDGAIVGKTVLGTGNTFMCSDKAYGDFILEFEFKVPEGMNSGVQFRSEFFAEEKTIKVGDKEKKVPADRVHGYQFEIDPSPRAYTGGVYDEARRGWLNDLSKNEAARKAFKSGEWNKARIECKGESIKTFVNGVPAADLKDGLTPKGIIGLQVHGIGKNGKPGSEIRWRNIRIQELK